MISFFIVCQRQCHWFSKFLNLHTMEMLIFELKETNTNVILINEWLSKTWYEHRYNLFYSKPSSICQVQVRTVQFNTEEYRKLESMNHKCIPIKKNDIDIFQIFKWYYFGMDRLVIHIIQRVTRSQLLDKFRYSDHWQDWPRM